MRSVSNTKQTIWKLNVHGYDEFKKFYAEILSNYSTNQAVISFMNIWEIINITAVKAEMLFDSLWTLDVLMKINYLSRILERCFSPCLKSSKNSYDASDICYSTIEVTASGSLSNLRA